MARSHKQFHASMIVLAGVYWWLLGWLFTPCLRFIGYLVGHERFTAWEQYWFVVFRRPRGAATELIPVDPLVGAIYLIYCLLGMVPLYAIWLYLQRRRSYLTSIADVDV
jgi:hypothetical protein